MFSFLSSPSSSNSTDLITSQLFDQKTFYEALLRDLHRCRNELIIESPFITSKRIYSLLPTIEKLRKRRIKILVNTRDPLEHENSYRLQAEDAVARLQTLGVEVVYTGGHHRKLVLLDRSILWEGSLNILSQNDTSEIMRRIKSPVLAQQMIDFLKIEQYLVQ
jgi:phosphatidylserine/phosphatidylglycerophosphate/cardiolipin synthase-like enzyme